jgi:hypothetical protein
MKKLSVSLFAVLALVIGVLSAFTTPAPKSTRAVEWFVLNTPVVYSTFSTNYATTYKFTSAYTSTTPINTPGISICSGTAKVCAVRIPTFSVGPNTSLLDDQQAAIGQPTDDDFAATVPADLGADLKYRN